LYIQGDLFYELLNPSMSYIGCPAACIYSKNIILVVTRQVFDGIIPPQISPAPYLLKKYHSGRHQVSI
jgi:hypothetical protein